MRVLNWVLAFWLLAVGAAWADGVEQGIVVTGEGRVSAPPDMATISLGVRQSAGTAKEAVGKVTDAVSGIIAQLDALGIPATDRQTSNFYLNPVYDNRPVDDGAAPRITQYEAGNSVTVTVRDLERLGPMMDAVIDIGANDFNGLSFGLQDPSEALAQARKLAVADAVARAGQLADAAELNLGTVLRMTESSQGPRPKGMAMETMRASMSDAIASGEVDVDAQVTMVFAIAPSN